MHDQKFLIDALKESRQQEGYHITLTEKCLVPIVTNLSCIKNKSLSYS